MKEPLTIVMERADWLQIMYACKTACDEDERLGGNHAPDAVRTREVWKHIYTKYAWRFYRESPPNVGTAFPSPGAR